DLGYVPRKSLGQGDRVGRYVILRRVGAGGMGEVFAAYDPELDRKVALKLVRTDGAAPADRQRLLREAQAMAQLSHPNVVTVFDVGSYEEQVFVAMEFIASGTLRDWLRARPRRPREILAMLVRAGRGLAA